MTQEEIMIWRAGVKFALREYAWWKDGIQYVGSCGTHLVDIITDVDDGKYDVEASKS